MNFPRFQPKIVHKGLALVLIPFLLNGFWFFLLSDQLNKTAKLVEVEQNQSDLLEHLYIATQLMMDASGNLFSFIITKRDRFKDQVNTEISLVAEELNYITRKGEMSSSQSMADDALLKLLKEQSSYILSFLSESQTETDILSQLTARKKAIRSVLGKSFQRANELLELFTAKKKRIDELRLKAKESRQAISALVFKGVAANLVLALVLAGLFVADISRRLAILVENARRLSKRAALAPPVSGSDELTYLDAAMHTAARDLQTAFDFRAGLMQMVAHDLRSPLQASMITLEALTEFSADKLGPGENAQIERVKSNNRRLIALINDLLTLDSLELGKLDLIVDAVAVRDLAEVSIKTLSAMSGAKKIEIRNSCGDQRIQADARRIEQVLINYLSNAVKFSPTKSSIEILSERRSGRVLVSVSDKGPGMSWDDSQKVFDKFYQATEGKKADGFGLGLAICRLIIESHGGQVGVTSERGKGSVFWFEVPEAPET